MEACDYTKLGADYPAFHCRFFSMEQLYHLIRRSNNADDLHREIAEVYVSTGAQNFWNKLVIRMRMGLGKEEIFIFIKDDNGNLSICCQSSNKQIGSEDEY